MLRYLCLALALASAGCQWSEDRYLKREATRAELVGTWRLTDYGLKSLRDVGVKEHLTKSDWEITLRSDGTCSARMGVNVSAADSSPLDYRTFGPDCSWRLDKFKHQEVRLFSPSQNLQQYFFLAEEDGKLFIWQYATDPDAWRYVEFEKTGT